MLTKELSAKVLDAALSNGADFAEIFSENNYNSNIRLYNNMIQQCMAGKDHGAGIRVFYGSTAIYAYTNDFSETALMEAASAVAKAQSGQKIVTIHELNSKDISNIHEVKILPASVSKEAKIDFLKRTNEAARNYSSEVSQVDLTLAERRQEILIANSEGLWVEDTRNYIRAFAIVIAGTGSERQTSTQGPGAFAGYEFIESLDPQRMGAETAHSSVLMLNAKYAPQGQYPVIIDNGFGGVIFHEACGHGLEATSLSRNASIFLGKLGQQVASDKVTAIDDGTLVNKWGSTNIDDEGAVTRRNVLIENGILKSYLIDKVGGLKMDMQPTGNGRRQSYKFPPTSRMTNTYIDAGNDKFDNMVASIDFGLYAKKMGGGSVLPGTGDFNFAVAEGYVIRNGKIAEPVRGATLIGNGAQILNKISMVSDNLELAEGMCGSQSGSVPTTVGQPALKVDEIIVGGRG